MHTVSGLDTVCQDTLCQDTQCEDTQCQKQSQNRVGKKFQFRQDFEFGQCEVQKARDSFADGVQFVFLTISKKQFEV